MSDKTAPEASEYLLELAADITSAYVSNNTIAVSELPNLIATAYIGLAKVNAGNGALESRPEPAVPVKKSVFPDYIICLEDGKKLKMLKRHLKTAYNMTPEQYRERWNLGPDYPLVAPNYAKQRSRLAKQIGLGTARRTGRK